MLAHESFEAVDVSPSVLWDFWKELDLARKIRSGYASFEPQPRYLKRPTTQVGYVRLPNGWVIGIAHRRRQEESHEWSLPDPKRIFIYGLALYRQ